MGKSAAQESIAYQYKFEISRFCKLRELIEIPKYKFLN